MTNKTISGLTAATTPLAGTELVPVWNGSATVKVSAANFTAGRPVSASSLTSTGTDAIYAQGGAANANPNAGAEANYLGCNFIWRVVNPGGSFNIWEAQLVQPNGYFVDNGDLVFKRLGTTKVRFSNAGVSVIDNVVLPTPGKGVTVTSPDGLTTKTITINNLGVLTLI